MSHATLSTVGAGLRTGFKLEGRTALVTGGSRGIGAAICRSLASQGATVAAGYSSDRERADEFVAEMTRAGAHASVHQGNVGDPEDGDRVIREVIEQHGALDILVNNAGITQDRPVLKMSVDDWSKVLRVNLSGAFFLSKPALEHMIERGTGAHHQHLVDHRPDREHRPSQLCGVEGGAVRADDDAGEGGRVHAGEGGQAR